METNEQTQADLPHIPPAPVIVEPLPFTEAVAEVGSVSEYTNDLVERSDKTRVVTSSTEVIKNAIKTYLDEIDTACTIPGGGQRVLHLTKKIRNLL